MAAPNRFIVAKRWVCGNRSETVYHAARSRWQRVVFNKYSDSLNHDDAQCVARTAHDNDFLHPNHRGVSDFEASHGNDANAVKSNSNWPRPVHVHVHHDAGLRRNL